MLGYEAMIPSLRASAIRDAMLTGGRDMTPELLWHLTFMETGSRKEAERASNDLQADILRRGETPP